MRPHPRLPCRNPVVTTEACQSFAAYISAGIVLMTTEVRQSFTGYISKPRAGNPSVLSIFMRTSDTASETRSRILICCVLEVGRLLLSIYYPLELYGPRRAVYSLRQYFHAIWCPLDSHLLHRLVSISERHKYIYVSSLHSGAETEKRCLITHHLHGCET